MSREDYITITQSIIALVTVLGGGVLFFSSVENREAVTGLIGVVLGYYFSGAPFDSSITNSFAKVADGVANGVKRLNGEHE